MDRRKPSDRARRVLFPADSPSVTENHTNKLQEIFRHDSKIMKEKYNFDFSTETPLEGDITWHRTSGRYDWVGVKEEKAEQDRNEALQENKNEKEQERRNESDSDKTKSEMGHNCNKNQNEELEKM